jgi:type 1 glutamine amidotransferase
LVLAFAEAAFAEKTDYRVLIFSKTAGFRHDSIPDGIAAIRELGAKNHFSVDATEDSSAFCDENLSHDSAVIFLNTTGTVLDDSQKAAFERYIQIGKGYVGIHSASDTEYDWSWYGGLVGAYLANHPAIQRANVYV